MKKILALTLSVLMIFALLAGCGGKADKLSDEEMIVGRWKWTVDVSKLFTMGMSIDGGKKAELIMYFDFETDGTYSISVDEASAEKMVADMTDIAKDLLKSIYPVETLEQMAAQEGVSVGTLLDELAAEAVASMDLSELDSEPEVYRFEDGKLYMDEETPGAFIYKLSAKKLELTGVDTSEMDEEEEAAISMMIDYIFPIVMTKVS